jgi:DNA polymerase-3 subunit gamma/tau
MRCNASRNFSLVRSGRPRERQHRVGLGFTHVEHGHQFSNLQQFQRLCIQACELKFPAAHPHRAVQADQCAQATRIDVQHAFHVEHDLFVRRDQLFHGFAQLAQLFAKHQASGTIHNDDAIDRSRAYRDLHATSWIGPGPSARDGGKRIAKVAEMERKTCPLALESGRYNRVRRPTMSYQVLARKYRPQRFSEVIGQDHVTRTLKNAIEQQRIAHGYIFSGHRGIGKTTIARILAMALNCRSTDHPVPEPCGVCDSCIEVKAGQAVDVIEIDAATNRGIDEIRELREAARYRPARDRFKIYILDEAHQITDAAFNALLKTLEEPPGHIVFMMATTEPEDIPQTIRSRCQHFSFHAVKFDDIVQQLRDIAGKEGIAAEDAALAMLAEAGDGSMRDALSIMDQAIAACGNKLEADNVRGLMGTVSSDVLEEIMNGVHANSSENVLTTIDKLLVEGHSPLHFAKQAVRFLRNATVAKIAGKDSALLQISSDERERVARVAEKFTEEDLARFLQIMLRTHSDLGYKHEQRFHLELGLLKLVHAQRMLPLEELLSGAASAPQGSGGSSPRPIAAPSRPATPITAASSARPSPFESSRPAAAPRPSPFEADRNRKTEPKAETPVESAPISLPVPYPVAQPARAFEPRSAAPTAMATSTVGSAVALAEVASEPAPAPATEISIGTIRDAVLNELDSAGQNVLVHTLETGTWALNGNEVSVKVALSPAMIDLSMGPEVKKMVTASVVKAAGRPMKFSLVGGADPATLAKPVVRATGGNSARSRAMQHPIVQYMQEKFGAEVRTVIDKKEER